jgi:hypothetical protein
MSTCKWLDLGTLGYRPVLPKILPKHYLRYDGLFNIEHTNAKCHLCTL